MNLIEIVTLFIAFIGVCFMWLASLGLWRLPDFYTRLHAVGQARTLGSATLLIGVAVYGGMPTLVAKILIFIGIVFLTTTIAAHALGRAAYIAGIHSVQATRTHHLAELHTIENLGQNDDQTLS
jgi:multicomponent Na+:H+ antiporter subunit G